LAYDELRLDEFHAMFQRRGTAVGTAYAGRAAGAVGVVAVPETMAVVVAMEKKRGAIHEVLRGRDEGRHPKSQIGAIG
jgi:hypothetical protein